MSQDKGKRAERDLANWFKAHGYPDASRAVKTGDRFAHDGGDLILEYDGFRLVCEVKHHAGGLTELQVAQFGAKLTEQVRVSRANMGVLIERRDRQPDPGRWWAHLTAMDLALLVAPRLADFGWSLGEIWVPVRCSVAYLAERLQACGLAQRTGNLVRLPASTPDGSAPMAETATGSDLR